jgi:hypothetical protein
MNKRWLAAVAAVFTALTALLVLLGMVGRAGYGVSRPALAAAPETAALTVTAVDPTSAPNDLDTPIVITGAGFLPELTGTLAMPPAVAYLGAAELEEVTWISSGPRRVHPDRGQPRWRDGITDGCLYRDPGHRGVECR